MLDTRDPQAFIDLSDAVREIGAYRARPDMRVHLERAASKIREALAKDPAYLRALYYDAIVDDLAGRSADAPKKFQAVLDALGEDDPIAGEVRYNIGVAYYHRYSWPYLDQAIAHFDSVISSTRDTSLKLLALSARAQAHAMHIIPKDPTKPPLEVMQRHARRAAEDVNRVLKAKYVSRVAIRRPPADVVHLARWAAHNAAGMRRMYLSDHWNRFQSDRVNPAEDLGQSQQKLLKHAIKDLELAEKERARDWANWCDIASANLRMGLVVRKDSAEHFRRAESYLIEVITRLRPDYGFALYELGRLMRVQGRFQEARNYFNRALEIPVEYREVGDGTVQREIARADQSSTEFP